MRFQFSLRTVGITVLFMSGILSAYLLFSRESFRQRKILEFLSLSGASWSSNADAESKLGELFGFDYPLDRVDSIMGSGRSDWGYVPIWNCEDSDLVVLREFKNLRELRIGGEGISNAGFSIIGSLTEIRELEVCGSSITDAGTSVLCLSLIHI